MSSNEALQLGIPKQDKQNYAEFLVSPGAEISESVREYLDTNNGVENSSCRLDENF